MKAKKKKSRKQMIVIDGHAFPEKTGGMTLVDAYYIPDEQVEQYRMDRELYAQKAMEVFARHCVHVSRDWKGSQDGEAVIGRDQDGEIIMLIHLDPDGIADMKKAEQEEDLETFLLASQ